MIEIFNDARSIHVDYAEKQEGMHVHAGGLAVFHDAYLGQVQAVLIFIHECRKGDCEQYLASLIISFLP